ncbi:ABC transporter substrate-binding protein [Streptomyces sp. TRM66268-LWL]|uniref:ABC transporter substrate-binding protein n=1 Tax=Streptomyces polyasparticus TaxID=2767826 RepID=A0ABR7SIS3_9ACTN|nr:ABC transporter substrate-binding protein [Streptomyces polyasparticus]MBC9714854.1 ABC transporter substrate-binding protein [Streptomyces polyasparticus]
MEAESAPESAATAWEFTDDRGHLVVAPRRPTRLAAYIQAGAALWDHGLRPAGIFGSSHDDPAAADPAKAGELPLAGLAYYGAGAALDLDALFAAEPDLLIAVTYGGGQTYGVTPEAAKHLEEHIPVVAVDVSQGRTLGQVRESFARLAHALGAAPDGAAEAELTAAEQRLRLCAAADPRPRVLALSPADADSVHLARPHAWPDLSALTALGVPLVAPPESPGANWATVSWSEAAALAPDLALVDVRAHAAALPADFAATVRTAPWNPELPPSPQAHTRFLDTITAALQTPA